MTTAGERVSTLSPLPPFPSPLPPQVLPRVSRPRGCDERRVPRAGGPSGLKTSLSHHRARARPQLQRVCEWRGAVPTSRVEDEPCACVCVSESGASLEGAGVAGPGPVEKPSQAKRAGWNERTNATGYRPQATRLTSRGRCLMCQLGGRRWTMLDDSIPGTAVEGRASAPRSLQAVTEHADCALLPPGDP